MEKSIKTLGLTISGSDDYSQDGELCVNHGVRKKFDVTTQAGHPVIVARIIDPEKILYIHHTTTHENVIIVTPEGENKRIRWIDINDQNFKGDICLYKSDVSDIANIGNILTISVDDKTISFLFVGGEYKKTTLENDLKIDFFYTQGKTVSFSKKVNTDGSNSDIPIEGRQTTIEETGQLLEEIAKLKKDGFCPYYILIRYALLTYDGASVYQSPPTLLAGEYIPIVYKKITDQNHPNLTTPWSGYIHGFKVGMNITATSIDPTMYSTVEIYANIIQCYDNYEKFELDLIKKTIKPLYYSEEYLPFPKKERERRISGNSQFYLIDKFFIPKEGVIDQTKDLDISELLKDSLQQQPVLIDETNSRKQIYGTIIYPYNARLHIANIVKSIFKGFNSNDFRIGESQHKTTKDELWNYYDQNKSTLSRTRGLTMLGDYKNSFIRVSLKLENGEVEVVSFVAPKNMLAINPYVSYPDSRAFKMEIGFYREVEKEHKILKTLYIYEIQLFPHPLMNMSFAINLNLRPWWKHKTQYFPRLTQIDNVFNSDITLWQMKYIDGDISKIVTDTDLLESKQMNLTIKYISTDELMGIKLVLRIKGIDFDVSETTFCYSGNTNHVFHKINLPDQKICEINIYLEQNSTYCYLRFGNKAKEGEVYNFSSRWEKGGEDGKTLTFIGGKEIQGCHYQNEYIEPAEKNNFERSKNEVLVSRQNNPSVFESKTSYLISRGEIINMCTSSKELSSGQYGDFPLYIFCTDGIFALRAGSGDALYSSVSPVSNDLCTGAIAPIIDSVAFAVKNRIMIIQGAQTQSISDQLIGVPKKYSFDNRNFNFEKYIQGASVGFVYSEKEIVVSNKDYNFYFVYQMDCQEWCTRDSFNAEIIKSTSKTYASSKVGLVDLSKEGSLMNIEIASRPIKLSPSNFKKVDKIIIRYKGNVRKENTSVTAQLFASNDALNYVELAKIQGSPHTHAQDIVINNKYGSYQYYAVTINVNNNNDNSSCEIRHIDISFYDRYNKRLR